MPSDHEIEAAATAMYLSDSDDAQAGRVPVVGWRMGYMKTARLVLEAAEKEREASGDGPGPLPAPPSALDLPERYRKAIDALQSVGCMVGAKANGADARAMAARARSVLRELGEDQ